MRDHFGEPLPFLFWKIDLHVSGVLPEKIKDLFAWRPNDFVDLVDLVKLIVTREQWAEREYLVHHATHTPNVHLVAVVTISKEAFRRSVPTGRNVFRQRLVLV